MSEIAIQKGIPVPKRAFGRTCRYPWHEMEVGDSFLFPVNVSPSFCYGAASRASQTYGKKFVVRKTTEGFRCWRVQTESAR